MGALDGERSAFGSDGSGARAVLSAMLAEAVRTCSMRLGPFCGPPRPACKAAHPVQDAVVDWMMSHAGEHAADAPIARPWVLVLTRPERSPTVGRFRPRWLRWHADERKGIPVFEDVVSPVDIRKHIRFFGSSSKKHLRFGMGYGNLRLVRWSLVPT